MSSSTYTHDFTQGEDSDNWNVTAGSITYGSNGAEFTITESGDAPTIQTNWYIFFGQVSVLMRAAPGTGIVSCAILESDDLDEIDWEWLGGSADEVQTNYFGKGNTTSYDRAQMSSISDTQSTTHNYTVVWTKNATTWYIDGTAIRTLNYDDALGGKNYPQTPMNIRIGIWAGGDSSNDEGTIEWARGETDYSDGPFTMYLEKVEVVNYNPGSSYSYGDQTGDWESIVINDGEGTTASPSASAEDGSSSATKASATSTGMWWTASASVQMAQAESSEGRRIENPGWQHVVLGTWIMWMVL